SADRHATDARLELRDRIRSLEVRGNGSTAREDEAFDVDLQATVSTQVCARRIELPRQAATPDTTDRIRRARERFADRCEHLCIEDLPPVARTAAESWRQESCDDTDPE